jgi:CheY-like chemotaxis protein
MEEVDGTTIMVVGDDPGFTYLMRRYVREAAHQPMASSFTEDALALASREKPAVILLEVDLPGTKCWRWLRALKADQTTRDIPVVLCSWLDDEERSLEEGADVYLRKPVLYVDFLDALKELGLGPGPEQQPGV